MRIGIALGLLGTQGEEQMSYHERAITRMERQDAIDDRDTRAVTPGWNDRPVYQPEKDDGGPCRNCGVSPAAHFREAHGLERLLCAESMLRAAYGDR